MQQPAGARPQQPAQAPAVRACEVDDPTLTLFRGPTQVLHGPKSPAVGIALVRMANCNLGAWDQGRRAAAGGGESSLLQRGVNLADNGIEILKARAAAGLPSSRILQGGWRAVQLDCSTGVWPSALLPMRWRPQTVQRNSCDAQINAAVLYVANGVTEPVSSVSMWAPAPLHGGGCSCSAALALRPASGGSPSAAAHGPCRGL